MGGAGVSLRVMGSTEGHEQGGDWGVLGGMQGHGAELGCLLVDRDMDGQ